MFAIPAETGLCCARAAGFGLQPCWCTNHSRADDWMGNSVCYSTKKPDSPAVLPLTDGETDQTLTSARSAPLEVRFFSKIFL